MNKKQTMRMEQNRSPMAGKSYSISISDIYIHNKKRR